MKKRLLCALFALFVLFGVAYAENNESQYVVNYNYSKKVEVDGFSIYIPSIFDVLQEEGYSLARCYSNDCFMSANDYEYTFLFSEEFAALPKEEKLELLEMEMTSKGYAFASKEADGCPAIVLMTYEKGLIPGVGEFDQYVESTISILADESILEIEISTPDENKAMEYTDGILAHLEAP